MTWLMGFKDPVAETEGKDTAVSKKPDEKAVSAGETLIISAPLAGKAVLLNQVKDETFASGMMGSGIAILPSEGRVYAPFNGKVETVPDSRHALGLCADSGIEMLIHVGLETVRLEGRYFTAHVKEGQEVHKGDLLLEFDLKAIAAEGFDTITPVIITNSDDYAEIIPSAEKQVKEQDTILKVVG